ncbi:hypothetical protein Hdeb2414_s0009g00319541 [Helianthus debilis subsp. tardiflorus]
MLLNFKKTLRLLIYVKNELGTNRCRKYRPKMGIGSGTENTWYGTVRFTTGTGTDWYLKVKTGIVVVPKMLNVGVVWVPKIFRFGKFGTRTEMFGQLSIIICLWFYFVCRLPYVVFMKIFTFHFKH